MRKLQYTTEQLKEAIQKWEENDDLYQMSTDFQGVDILDEPYIDEDELEAYEEGETDDVEVHYSAKVYWLDHNEEFYDCYIMLSNLKHFLPKLSLK